MNDKCPKYSFVMPAYKGQFLYESIMSILNQQYNDFELVVVDDDSPDNIKEIVSRFPDDRISYYRNEKNIGGDDLVAQWNKCIKYAKGEWVILATDDDVYELNFLTTADMLLSKYPNCDIFRGRVCSCDSNGNVYSIEASMPEITSVDNLLFAMFNGLQGGIPQYVIRKSVLDCISGFCSYPKAWGSDDYTALLLASRSRIIFSSEILLKFRMSDSNISSRKKHIEDKLTARIQYYANIYEKIFPGLDDKSIYTHLIKTNYNKWVWFDLLQYLHLLPIYRRHIFFKEIIKNTPFFNEKTKKKLLLRAYIRKIKIELL